MMEVSPTEYEVIVIGTGLAESIIAAACSRVGKSVLHLDINGFYGEQWSSFTLGQFEKHWTEKDVDGGAQNKSEVKYHDFIKDLTIENYIFEDVKEIVRDVKEIVKEGEGIYKESGVVIKDGVVIAKDVAEIVKDVKDIMSHHGNVAQDVKDIYKDAREIVHEAKEVIHEVKEIVKHDAVVFNDVKEIIRDSKEIVKEANQHAKDVGHKGVVGQTKEVVKAGGGVMKDVTACEAEPKASTSAKPDLETAKDASKHAPKVDKWCLKEFEKAKRRVNVDITPKLVYSNGTMVNLLRDSNCSRYLEFKAINRCFVYHNKQLVKAPCNRAEVFSSTQLKVLEKRLLMKFISFTMDLDLEGDVFKSWEGRTDVELYKDNKLTEGLIELIRSSLVRTNKIESNAQEVLIQIKKFLKGVGVFGNLPFIFPVYGSGEFPQAFARFSAVFGSVYVLMMAVDDIKFNSEGLFESVTLSNKQVMTGKTCVISPNYQSVKFSRPLVKDITVSHSVLILDRSIKHVENEDKDDVSIMTFLPNQLSNKNTVTLYEFGPGSCVPAQNQYLVQIQTRAGKDDTPVGDLKPFVEEILKISGARLLWAAYFSTQMKEEGTVSDIGGDQNIWFTSKPVYNSCYDDSIVEAREVFEKVYPGEEFLPMAPNPEDIKWPDEEGDRELEVEAGGEGAKEGDKEEENDDTDKVVDKVVS